MGVIRTDEWLNSDFRSPVKICENIISPKEAESFYHYLVRFGMYKPNRKTLNYYLDLKEQKVWNQVSQIHRKYQKEWNGPDINIYIFPMSANHFMRNPNKSGVSFKDKVFLFLSPLDDKKEIEALFVHEYHHICRMDKQKKEINNYTLLDSIVLEGLAEYMVEQYCGKSYRSKWCTYYTRKEILGFWEKWVKNQLDLKKNSQTHDSILFGEKGYPPMIGYAIGYEMILLHKEKQGLTLNQTLRLPSEHFSKEIQNLTSKADDI